MKRIVAALSLVMVLSGCTAEQQAEVQVVENDLHAGVVAAQNAVVAVEDHEAQIEQAEQAIAALAPKSAAVQKALADAQAAITALKNNKGTTDQVLEALAVVEKLSAPDANQKAMPKRPRKKKQKATTDADTAATTSGSSK